MGKKKTILSLLVVGSFALSACGSKDDEQVSDNIVSDVEEQEQTATENDKDVVEESTVDAYTNIKVTPEKIYDTFMDKYPNTKINKLELDQDDGNYVYEIEGFGGTTEYELKIDSINGTILKEETEEDNDINNSEITRSHVEKVMDLVDSVLAEAGEGAMLEEWTLDMDDGIVKLEVEIEQKDSDDEERTYNVETGELIKVDD